MDAVAWYSIGGFVGNIVAGVLAGLIVVGVGYFAIDRKLRLKERADRAKELETHRRENREAVLSAVHTELEHDAAQLATALAEVPKADRRLVYPLFETTMWQTVSAPDVFATVNATTIESLIFAYNRMVTANEWNAVLVDFSTGATSILAALSAASSLDKPLVEDAYSRFLVYRDTVMRAQLIDRLQELKPHLDAAIDAVEAELGRPRELPAARRIYGREKPIAFSPGFYNVDEPSQD